MENNSTPNNTLGERNYLKARISLLKKNRTSHLTKTFGGIAAIIAGIVVSFLSFDAASGGVYFVFCGIIIYGFIFAITNFLAFNNASKFIVVLEKKPEEMEKAS